jgi:hypothetical protein
MGIWNGSQKSVLSLIHQLSEDAKVALRKELELAKAEISEKLAKYGVHAAVVGAAGLLAYAGLIVLLICLAILISLGLKKAGVDQMLAIVLGLGFVALLVMAVGATFAFLAIKKLKALSPLPTKALSEAKQLGAAVTGKEPQLPPPTRLEENKQSSSEAQADMRKTRYDLSNTVEELKERMTLRALGEAASSEIKAHPVRVAVLGVGTGLVSYLIIQQKSRARRQRRAKKAQGFDRQSENKRGILGKFLAVVKGIELINQASTAVASFKNPARGSVSRDM